MSNRLSHDALANDLTRHLARYSVPMAIWEEIDARLSGDAVPSLAKDVEKAKCRIERLIPMEAGA